jgi:hypothetical protein
MDHVDDRGGGDPRERPGELFVGARQDQVVEEKDAAERRIAARIAGR